MSAPDPHRPTRLDRVVAHFTARSRKDVARLARRGLLIVDGVAIKNASHKVVPSEVTIVFEGQPLELASASRPLTLLMHKPAGVVCARTDGLHETVMDLVPTEWRLPDLAIVGRLDEMATGLLVLSADGQLNHRLTHPRRDAGKVGKRYLATIEGTLVADAEARFTAGIELKDGTLCRPASLERIDDERVRVTVHEGKYHQVRRMLAACGGHVVALHREGIGALELPSDLEPGSCRPATDEEIAQALDGG